MSERDTKIELNTRNWSEQSRRSLAAEFAGTHYQDQPLRCRRCDREFVFTAAQQRQAFEVRKAYIWQHPILCAACLQQRIALTGELRRLQRQWRAQRATFKRDIAALRRWRELLRQLPFYGCRRDVAQIAMMERLLDADDRREAGLG